MAAPNQRKTTVNKEICDKNHPYAAINLRALQQAMKDLIPVYPAAFELWVYLSKNQNGYTLEVSPEDMKKNFGISNDRYQKAWRILVDRGYIVESSKTMSRFYEIPQQQENPVFKQQENPVVIDETEIQKQDNPVMEQQENPVVITGKSSYQQQENPDRNNIYNTYNNTNNNTEQLSRPVQQEEEGIDLSFLGDLKELLAGSTDEEEEFRF